VRARDERGASSVEYGLMIALICAVLCVGVGVTLNSVFGGVVQCFVGAHQGATPPNCPTTGGSVTVDSGNSGGAGVPAASPTPSVTPTPSPTATPSPSPTPTP
jgi:Flp pilus assembly pilin Flp